MNTEIKVLLTITIEGGALHRSDTPEVRTFVIRKEDYDLSKKWKNGEGKQIVKKGKYTIYPYIQSTATLQTKICKDAYNFMISPLNCPEWFRKPKEWKRLTPIQRLEAHFQRTCDNHRGKSFSYSIIED